MSDTIEVFVVRQFFEDCNDNSYTGVYTDFWKAVAGAKADQEENWGDEPEYGLEANPSDLCRCLPPEIDCTQVWFEVTWKGKGHGIYYTIDRLELE